MLIPLHCHSNFSLLKGTIPVKELVRKAKSFGLPGLALTDEDNMQGIIQFIKECNDSHIKPVIGTQLVFSDEKDDYVILLARNNQGYHTLCKLITQKKLTDKFHFADLSAGFSEDLYYLTPKPQYYEKLHTYRNVYFEVLPGGKCGYSDFAKKARNCVFSNPVFFLLKDDFALHRIVTAIRKRKTIASVSGNDMVDAGSYFKSLYDVSNTDIPESWLQNSQAILNDCNVDLQLGRYKFPAYSVPEGHTSFSFLWKLCHEGLQMRYQNIDEKVRGRLDYELEVIQDLNFTDYFLVVWDLVIEAKRRGMMMIGRGSAANSLVAYCLGFTEVDPIKYNLYFERFLNRSRTSPPDVDLDFSWKERDEIVKYVFERYGYDKVAMISTTVTFRARSAFRETAKVFGFSDEQISKYSKFIPWTSAANLERLPELFPEAKNLEFKDEIWQTILRHASRLAGFPRHLSIHPSGILITPEPITHYTALEYAKNKGLGIIVTQPDMYSIEELGLVKIDLLSQRSLGVLRASLQQIDRNY